MTLDEVVEAAARAAHEANRSYCLALGDDSQATWEQAPDWQRNSARQGARLALVNPEHTPRHSHESWTALKLEEGWKYGPVKDPDKREHPCLVPYDDLPPEQQAKDLIFITVVRVVGEALRQRRQSPSTDLTVPVPRSV